MALVGEGHTVGEVGFVGQLRGATPEPDLRDWRKAKKSGRGMVVKSRNPEIARTESKELKRWVSAPIYGKGIVPY